MFKDINAAISKAMAFAKQRRADEVSPDDLLRGCLSAISRFGVARIGDWCFDLAKLGVDWLSRSDAKGPKVSYSDAVVEIFDRASRIARADGSASLRLEHLFVAFADEEAGLMGQLRREFKIDSTSWRAAGAELSPSPDQVVLSPPDANTTRDYLTSEEAAVALDIHVQTLRAYVRSGKLPALRLAGEREIRIRRSDLEKVLEPLVTEQ
jgi:excisionase family DNA binding protein